ncbi:citrate:proton symporter [Cytobacillus firmus]|uniref:Citrate/H+ symporter of CitMHS family n=1 Tax=Cytobacillus firmus TaxID=1399 RepID=A0A800MYC6_CYTFI|nr:citrate:proton symporter [Cytobacillus firmus]KAF0824661.1 Citrate/H+ symporter of CitMHS family [Cytobacillus firmus]
MLSILGFAMIFTFLFLIMTKRTSPFLGLTLVPIIFGLIGGFGQELGPLMIEGVINVAPTAILLLFAILYFGIMLDTGLFDPLTSKIIKLAKGDPLKIIVGTAVLAGLIGFDGDGSTTMMIVVTAFLPLYKKMGISPIILASITIMQIGITTLVPWGGPAGRVASVLNLDATELYLQMLPGMLISLLYVIGVAYLIGLKERARYKKETRQSYSVAEASIMDAPIESATIENISTEVQKLKRPKMIWLNFFLSAVIMVAIVLEWLPAPILFIIGTALALLINYPGIIDQRVRVAAHAPNALAVVLMVLAAGIFSGIFKGTPISESMAQSLVTLIPTEMGAYMALFTAVVSAPALFLIGPDGFYFGILPVLAETAAAYNIDALAVGTASLYGTPFGIMGPLVASVYLLIHITGITLGELHKHAAKWSLGILLIYIVVGVFLGTISLW